MPIDIDELERLEKAATPGPWAYFPDSIYAGEIHAVIHPEGESLPVGTQHITSTPDYDDRPDDMALIVAARNALPELLAELKRLRQLRWEVKRAAIREAAGEFNAERFEAITGRSLSGEQAEEGSATAGQTDAT
jgi:hypothetical protein